jgi:hypothetical protein
VALDRPVELLVHVVEVGGDLGDLAQRAAHGGEVDAQLLRLVDESR